MNLPRLVPIQGLPFSLPVVKSNQVWALNQDTVPPSLVLIEFVYTEQQSIQSASQESVNLLNTSLNHTLSSISSDLTNLSSRVQIIETVINTSNFTITSDGQLVASTGTV